MELEELIAHINQLQSEIDAHRPLSPEQEQRIMQKFRLDWNYHSNAIEGNQLTMGETRAFLLHGITAKGKPFKDYLDMKGHNDAIRYLESFVRQNAELRETDIREMHKILLGESYGSPAISPEGLEVTKRIQVGQYKTVPNHVQTQSGDIHYYATLEDTPIKMGELMAWYRKNKSNLHPLVLAATFHYRFVAIHPFDDGNGRMARLLMNLILMERGLVPIVVKEEGKGEYLLALEQGDAGDLEPFVVLMGEQLKHSMELYLRGAKREDIEEWGDLDKKLELLEKKLKGKGRIKNVEKSQKLVDSVGHHVFIPILKLVKEKISRFEPFFESVKEGIQLDEKIAHEYGIETLEELMKAVIDSPKNKYGYIFELGQLIGNPTLDIHIGIEITLRKYDWQILYQIQPIFSEAKMLFSGTYSQFSFSQKDLKSYVLQIANEIYSIIEEHSQ